MNWREHIEQNPQIMVGKPVFKGTRLTVQHVLERMAAGDTERELLESYPRLTTDHIRAALAFAADSLSLERVVFMDSVPK